MFQRICSKFNKGIVVVRDKKVLCWNYILLIYSTMKWNSKERVKLGDENYSKNCIVIGLFVVKDNKLIYSKKEV